jgi:hypothetical protein
VSLNRYAKRKDENQPQIVKALRDVGAKVRIQDFPDLAVKYRGKLHWLEVSNPQNKYRKRKAEQLEFLREWEIPIVETEMEALLAIGAKVEVS